MGLSGWRKKSTVHAHVVNEGLSMKLPTTCNPHPQAPLHPPRPNDSNPSTPGEVYTFCLGMAPSTLPPPPPLRLIPTLSEHETHFLDARRGWIFG